MNLLGVSRDIYRCLSPNEKPQNRTVYKFNHVFLLQSIFRSEGVNDLTPYSLTNSLKNLGVLCAIPFTGELCKSVLFSIFGPSVQYFDGVVLMTF